MRFIAFLALFAASCGDDSSSAALPDVLTGNRPEPAVIPGGGIGGGAIDGVVNLYVIDDSTRLPVSGATVRVGTVEGTTDADGLFIAEGLVGSQDVVVVAPSYRSEVWLGANGANMTANLQPQTPVVPQATLTGTITNLSALTVAQGHVKIVVVGYSHDDKAGDAANNLKTPADDNVCIAAPNGTCTFDIVTRTGKVSLQALVFDRDLNNSPTDPTDDTQTFLGFAVRTGITVAAGVNQTGQDLTMIPNNMLASETVAFGTPPAGLQAALGIIGIELGDGSGVLQYPFASPTSPTAVVPALSYFTGAMYRLTAIAQNNAMPATASFVVRRHLTSTTLTAGTWTDPPTNISLTRTRVSWTPSANALLHSAEYGSDGTALLNITSFDTSTSADIPDLIVLPSGMIRGRVNALSADGLDLMDLALDRDRDKISGAASTPGQVN